MPTLTQALYASIGFKDFTFSLFRNHAQYSSATDYLPSVAIYDPGAFIGMGSTILSARYKANVGDFALDTCLSSNTYQVDPGSNYKDVYDNFQAAYKYAYGTDAKGELQVIWTPTGPWTVTAGASYDLYTSIPWSADLQSPVDTTGAITGTDIGTPFPAIFYPLRYTNLGSYLQAQVRLSDSLTGTMGARYDDNSRYGNTFNPRLGLVWNLGAGGTLKALYGSAFLAPSPFEAYQHYGSFTQDPGTGAWSGSFWVLPNPSLSPMKERTAEVAYLVPLGRAFHFSASLYEIWLQDLFSTQDFIQGVNATPLYPGNLYQGLPVADIEIPVNLGKQTNQGGNLRLDYVHAFGANSHLTAYVDYSFITGKVDPQQNGTTYNIGDVTPSMTRFGLDVLHGAFSFSPTLTLMGTQRLSATDAAGNPLTINGYSLLNLPFRYQVLHHLEAFLTVSNALDKHYRVANDFTPGYAPLGAPQDPRRISGGLRVNF
jgi:iron complex outermembrane receptor protein